MKLNMFRTNTQLGIRMLHIIETALSRIVFTHVSDTVGAVGGG